MREGGVLTRVKRGNYNRYSTALKARIKSGLIPGEFQPIVDSISPSTIYSIKKNSYNNILGLELNEADASQFEEVAIELAKSQKLVKTVAACLKIKNCLIEIARKIKGQKISIREKKTKLIHTIANLKERLPLGKLLTQAGISFSTFYNWTKELAHQCHDSAIKLCLRHFPTQITKSELKRIRLIMEDRRYMNWPLISLYWQAHRHLRLNISLSTFYKYVNILGYKRTKPGHRRKRHLIGLRALYPNQYWHVDVTQFKSADNITNYIYLVIDNYSRRILAWLISLKLAAQTTKEMLIEAYNRHIRPDIPAPEIMLIVDGGSENKAEVDQYLAEADVAIRKLVACRDITFSNSMIEAVNKKIKYENLYHRHIADQESLKKLLPEEIFDYNNRPHGALKGLTPMEAYKGHKFDQQFYRDKINYAQKTRIRTNISHSCPSCAGEKP